MTIRKRDDHPHGARGKSRTERVVDLHEPRTLEAVSRYVMHERPLEATSPFVFLVGRGRQRCEPLSYDALVKLFSRRNERARFAHPGDDPACPAPHACHGHVGGRHACELSLQKRLGHASPESVKVYTRVSDEAVLAEHTEGPRARPGEQAVTAAALAAGPTPRRRARGQGGVLLMAGTPFSLPGHGHVARSASPRSSPAATSTTGSSSTGPTWRNGSPRRCWPAWTLGPDGTPAVSAAGRGTVPHARRART